MFQNVKILLLAIIAKNFHKTTYFISENECPPGPSKFPIVNYDNLVISGIAWAPHSSCHICTAGDDHQALIWDIQQMPRAIEDPILAYTAAEGEINQIQWGATQPDWIGEDTARDNKGISEPSLIQLI